MSNSLIHNNGTGVYIYNGATPLISAGNVITANTYGIKVVGYDGGRYPQPVIAGNDIFGNTYRNFYAVNLVGPTTAILNARNNWWGSASPVTIAATIDDYTDSPNDSPVVDYGGYLDNSGGTPATGNFLNGPFLCRHHPRGEHDL